MRAEDVSCSSNHKAAFYSISALLPYRHSLTTDDASEIVNHDAGLGVRHQTAQDFSQRLWICDVSSKFSLQEEQPCEFRRETLSALP
jgi:hypothetical protein